MSTLVLPDRGNRIRVVFVITGLATGGAEMMLLRLVSGLDRTQIEPIVISLLDEGVLGAQFCEINVPVYSIGMRPGFSAPFKLIRLAKIVNELSPDILQGWMYHGNIAAQISAQLIDKRIPVIWNVRHSLHDINSRKLYTRLAIYAGSLISGLPKKIIYNAKASLSQHESLGYNCQQATVIPNGFDLAQFQPNSSAYLEVRRDLGVASDTRLIGLFGRYHPIKGHQTFIKAAAILSRQNSSVQFVLAGRNVSHSNAELRHWIQDMGLNGRIHLLGERTDMPRLSAALDLAVSSSVSEGFPNVIGEAMASGVPCVVTDVGDSAWLVGGSGAVVASGDPAALAASMNELLTLAPTQFACLKQAARKRISDHFSLDSVIHQYESLYFELTNNGLDAHNSNNISSPQFHQANNACAKDGAK